MANVQYYDVILKPVVTEKSMSGMADKKYTFYVHPDANKTMIKEAVEKMFEGTKVKSVNTLNLEGKNKRRGRTVGKTAARKKAIVQLTEDSKDIELFWFNPNIHPQFEWERRLENLHKAADHFGVELIEEGGQGHIDCREEYWKSMAYLSQYNSRCEKGKDRQRI